MVTANRSVPLPISARAKTYGSEKSPSKPLLIPILSARNASLSVIPIKKSVSMIPVNSNPFSSSITVQKISWISFTGIIIRSASQNRASDADIAVNVNPFPSRLTFFISVKVTADKNGILSVPRIHVGRHEKSSEKQYLSADIIFRYKSISFSDAAPLQTILPRTASGE